MKKNLIIFIFIVLSGITTAQEYFQVRRTSFSTSNFNEFSPVFYKNDLVFCTDLSTQVFVTYTTPDNENLIDIHVSKNKGDLKWSNSRLFARSLNTNFNEGPVTFSPDGNTIYFTRSIDADNAFGNSLRGDTTYGIFSAEWADGSWTNIQPFKYNRLTSNTGFPFLTDDGETLFFCSNMPGGEGGLDIWKVERRNRTWGRAENLGPPINTPGNEVSPFLHESGRLYFASNGHHDRSDVDIYYVDHINGEWTEPVLPEGAFNSYADDFGFIANSEIDTGFYTTNRRGTDDIYQFYSPYPSFTDCPEQQENDYCFVFFEQGTMDLDTTSLQYEWDLGDGTKIRGAEAEHCFEGPGNYEIKLNVIDTLTGEVSFNQATYQFPLEPIEQAFITAPDSVKVNEPVTMNGENTYLKNLTPQNYYWEMELVERYEGIEAEHTFTRPGEYIIELGVTNGAEDIEELQKHCVKRKIVVLE
ncbi:MAG: PKD domain-containing protein [Bacteroidetes bacterium]|jgi:plastocyanin|nr:PKD domain-containing protein [Bacteroidota bacterium]